MRIGTRGSTLALAQARLVVGSLDEGELVVVRTSGDRQLRARPSGGNGGRSTHAPGGDKSRWVAELEQALLAGEIDLAVHSAKDVPGELADGLELLGTPARAAVEDVLVGARSLEELPKGACVGTSSVRRTAQLRAARADLEVVSLRGNVDTRLRKLASEVTGSGRPAADRDRRDGDRGSGDRGGGKSQFNAIVLASAGLWRLGRERDIGCTLDAARFVPAPGQGALALQARKGDAPVRAAVETIVDRDASA
jgi:hydroxymethylbilane synthase